MSDNTILSPGAGGDTIRSDDIGGIKIPASKINLGINGVDDGFVATGNPLPITGTLTAVTAITNALPAGTNAIGKLAANSGVDIGDVDVTSVSGNVTVVQGTGTNLHTVVDSGTITTVSTLTAITTNTPSGSIAHDGAAAAVNPLLMGGYASAAAPADVSADNDAVRAWHLRNGASATVITAAGALVGGDAANGLDVDVTRMSALVAGAAIIGKVGVDQTTPGTTNAVFTTNWPTTVDTNSGVKSASTIRVVIATDQPQLTNKLLVTPDANSAVNVAQVGGTNAVAAGLAGTLAVGGSVATNVAITSNPINTGAQGISSENMVVTTGRMVQLVADLVGKLIVLPYANPENFVSFPGTAAMTSTTSTITLAAPAAGLRNYITSITVSNGSSTIPTDILIQDGSGGTTLYTIPAPIGAGTGTGTSGGHYTFPVAIRQPTTATAIYVANVTTGSSTKVSMAGYKGV